MRTAERDLISVALMLLILGGPPSHAGAAAGYAAPGPATARPATGVIIQRSAHFGGRGQLETDNTIGNQDGVVILLK